MSIFSKSARKALLLGTILVAGVNSAWADEVTVYDGTATNAYLPVYGYYADSKGGISEFIIPSSDLAALNGSTIEKMVFYLSSPATASWGSASFNVYLEEVAGSNYDDSSASQLTDGKTLVYAGALDGTGSTMEVSFSNSYSYSGGNLLVAIEVGTAGTYKAATFSGTTTSSNAGRYKYSSSSGRAKFIPKTTFFTPTEGPALSVKDGNAKLTSPYSYSFGLATAGTTKTFTLSNPGTETTNVSVSHTGNFGAELSATSIAAGESVMLTVTMPEATGDDVITISSSNEGIDDFVFNVSGTIRDANKLYEYGFTALPEDWTTTGTWYYSEANGAYTTVWYLSSNARLITPLLTIGEGETFFVEAKGYSTSNTSYQHLQMQYSADGTTWTNFDAEPTLDPSAWNTFSFTGAPAGNYYIAINASQADIRMFYGGEQPKMAKMVVTQPASLNYGIIAEAKEKTFTIANTGKAELKGIEVTSSNAAFTIANAPASLAAGESQEVTITMSADNTGAFSSLITVSATDMEDVTFTVTGVVMPNDAFVIDFNDNQLPNGWTNAASNKWSFDDGKAYCTAAAELVSPKLQFAEGDFFVINATSYDDYDNNYIEITGSVDGSDWTAFTTKKFISRSQIPYGTYAPLVVTDIPTTVQYIKIKGYYVRIDDIAGLTYNQNAPVLAVSPTTEAAFGKVKSQPEAKTYTVTNVGTGTMSGTITTSDDTQFTVSEREFSLDEGESMTFDIALVFDDNYGAKTATITVTPDYDADAAVTITATATTADPNVWEEDFEDGMPTTWNNSGVWTVSTPTASGSNGTQMATISSYNNPKTLTTPRLEAKADDELSFYIGMQYDDEPLTIEYSNDDKATWNTIEDGVESYTASANLTFKAPADGFYYVRFTGTYAMLDNFNGFKLAIKDHEADVASSNIPTTGNQFVEYTASVTVKELAGKAEELTAKFFIGDTQYGEDVVETVEANGTKTFTVSFTPSEAVSGDAYFTVSNNDLNLETEKVAVAIASAPEISEDAEWTQTSGTLPVAIVKYTAQNGWNTIAMPFKLDANVLTALFGEGYQAYELKGYNDGKLVFGAPSNFYAGYPYLVYTENAPAGQSSLQVANVSLATAGSDYHTANVAATYATAEEAWGVAADGTIATGTVKPLHATITMPEGFEGTPRIALSVTVGTSGWASLFTAPALDFQAVEGMKAYTATVDVEKSTVTLNAVDDIQGNTGVVIQAEPATYAVPLCTGGSVTSKGDLKGSATQSTPVTSDSKFYGLSIVDGYAQFTRIEEGGSILAGRAFLQLPAETEANAFSVVFGDEATGISQLRTAEGNGNVYDMNGRQMSGTNLKKGLYIKDGKKVLVK